MHLLNKAAAAAAQWLWLHTVTLASHVHFPMIPTQKKWRNLANLECLWVATDYLIKCWKYVVCKLDFSNWCHTSSCQANSKANDALLTCRSVEYSLISFKQQRNMPTTSITRSSCQQKRRRQISLAG